MSAHRPIEVSKAVVCDVRFTSTPVLGVGTKRQILTTSTVSMPHLSSPPCYPQGEGFPNGAFSLGVLVFLSLGGGRWGNG